MVNYFTYIKQTLCEKYQKIYLHKFILCDFSLYTTNTYVQMDTLNSHTHPMKEKILLLVLGIVYQSKNVKIAELYTQGRSYNFFSGGGQKFPNVK